MDASFFLSLGSALKIAGIVLTPLFLVPLIALALPGSITGLAKRLIGWIDALSSHAMNVAMFSALVVTMGTLLIVFVRFAFGLSFTWLNEIVIYAFAATFMLGASAALRDDAHVRVDILRPRFGEAGRNWVELAGLYLLLFPICVRILTTQEQGLALSWRLFEGSRESDGLPIFFLFKTLLPAFAVLMLAQGLSEACKAALRLTGQLPPAGTSNKDAVHGA